MGALLLILALAAPVAPAEGSARGARPVDTCALAVHALDARGEDGPARAVSAREVPAVVLLGRLLREPGNRPALVFDVFNPSGQRYQVLEARTRAATVVTGRSGFSRRTRVRLHEARLAVAGSSIAWTSMYGTWRVVPRLEGADEPCGRPVTFTIAP